MRLLFLLLFLAACGRGLTENERALMFPILGETFDADQARMLEAGFIGLVSRTYAARPQVTCRERIAPAPSGPTVQGRTAGAVLWTHVLTRPDWTLPDYARNYPSEINLVAAMFFAHEMTHIWQWQNRQKTGYAPLRGLAEHKPGVDPYLFDPNDKTAFLDMGFEQQAALVEEFICCRTIAPEAARTQRLYETLRAVMPVQPPSQSIRPDRVFGIDQDADLTGICD